MMDLWNCPTLRALTGNLCTQWFIIGLTYYGLTLATSRFPGSVYFNLFASALVEIPAYYIAMRVMDVHGRRKVLIASHVTVSVACSLYLLFSGPSTAAGVARSVLAMVGKLGVSGAFGVCVCLCVYVCVGVCVFVCVCGVWWCASSRMGTRNMSRISHICPNIGDGHTCRPARI
jgi:hypothetical protein